jgi:type I restriction enzyme, S subunit
MKSYKDVYHGESEELQMLCESITDCHHSTPTYLPEGKLVVRNFNIRYGRMLLDKLSYTDDAHFEKRVSRAKPESGDLIITREAPMGEVCLIPEDVECCLGQRMVLIKPDRNKVDNRFLLYALLSDYLQTQIEQSNGTGSIVSNLRIPVLKELRVPKVKLTTQRIIGEILGAIDEKIELNNKINSELEAMAKLIYEYWFVQFDFPDENGKPYKSSGGKMVFNEELKREIPEGWEVKPLGELVKFERGISYKSKEITESGIPMINLNSFKLNGQYKSKGLKCFSGSYKESKIVSAGDLVIAITDVTRNADIIGKAFTIPDLFDCNILISCDVAKVVPLNTINAQFLEPLFNSDHYHRYIKHFASGTLVLHLNLDGVKWCKIPLPPIKIIDKYSEFRKNIDKKLALTHRENKKLTELRDWLLPMLMNGQVTVNKDVI